MLNGKALAISCDCFVGEVFSAIWWTDFLFVCFVLKNYSFVFLVSLISQIHAFSFCFNTLVSSLPLLESAWLFVFKVTWLWFVFNIETMNQATPARKLEEVLHLAELCIEVLQQNEEHHAEVMTCFNSHIKPRIMLCDSGKGTEDVARPQPLIHTWPFIWVCALFLEM